MSAAVLYMSMSLDGFIAGPNESLDIAGPNESLDNGLGDGGERLHEWASARVPIFILTRQQPYSFAAKWPLVTPVSDVTAAMTRAREAAGDKSVLVHGAGTAQLALAAGVLDEIELHLIPVLFGQGRRMFEGLAAEQFWMRAVIIALTRASFRYPCADTSTSPRRLRLSAWRFGPGRGSRRLPPAPTTAESSVSANVGPRFREAARPLRTGLRILAPFTTRDRSGYRVGMSQKNLEAVQEVISAVNDRDLDRYLAHCTESIQLETPWAAVEGVYKGPDAIRRLFSDLRDTLPDFHLVIERLEPIGSDRVLAFLRVSATGRASGIAAGAGVLSATGRDIPSANIYDFAGGKIRRIRVFLDRQEALDAVARRE